MTALRISSRPTTRKNYYACGESEDKIALLPQCDAVKEKGYEIIFDKAACLFIDEKYDITDEIIKGLNERYNKVESK